MTTADKYNQILTALSNADTPEATEAIELLKEVEQLFLKTGGLMVAARDRLKASTAWLEVFRGVASGETPTPKPEGVELIIKHNKALVDKLYKEKGVDG